MVARIYNPSRSVMQSGLANTKFWILQYEPEKAKTIEPLMGYTSTSDMYVQISIRFPTKEQAVAFAHKYEIPYRVENYYKANPCRVSYSDNFRADRKQPWTH